MMKIKLSKRNGKNKEHHVGLTIHGCLVITGDIMFRLEVN